MNKITACKPHRWFEVRMSECNPDYRHGVYHTPFAIVEICVWPERYELNVIRNSQLYIMKVESPYPTDRELKLQAYKFAQRVFLTI